ILVPGQTSPTVQAGTIRTDDSFTYLVTPRFKVSPDFMVYARVASGYEPGVANLPTQPPAAKPETTRNYEIGTKGDIFDHALSFDASLYYIDWVDIQVFALDPTTGIGYNTNGGRAKSEGVELEVQSKPVKGLKLGAWVAWNDAVLTQSFPS